MYNPMTTACIDLVAARAGLIFGSGGHTGKGCADLCARHRLRVLFRQLRKHKHSRRNAQGGRRVSLLIIGRQPSNCGRILVRIKSSTERPTHMKVTFIGADHEVTGSCTHLELCGKHILVDYGMEQGKGFLPKCKPAHHPRRNRCSIAHPRAYGSLRSLPLLYKNGFKGSVHATTPTHNLCDIMLRDSAHIQEFEAEWRNRKGARSGEKPYVPLYVMTRKPSSNSLCRTSTTRNLPSLTASRCASPTRGICLAHPILKFGSTKTEKSARSCSPATSATSICRCCVILRW